MDKRLRAFTRLQGALVHIEKELCRTHQAYGLTDGQFAVLEALYQRGDLSVGQVKERIHSSSGTMPIIVKNLEKMGLVIKKKDKLDKRKNIISLTTNGRDLISRACPHREKKIREIFSGLSSEELTLLSKLCKKLEDSTKEL